MVTEHGYGLNIRSDSAFCVRIYRPHEGRLSLLQLAIYKESPDWTVNREIVKMLMEAGVEMHTETITMAIRLYDVELIKLLVKGDENLLRTTTNAGSLANVWALGADIQGLRVNKSMSKSTLQYLAENNVDMEALDEYGNTPLLLSAMDNSRNLLIYVKYMTKQRREVHFNHRNNKNRSAMHMLIGFDPPSERDDSDTSESRGVALNVLLQNHCDSNIGAGEKDARSPLMKVQGEPRLRTPSEIICLAGFTDEELLNNNGYVYDDPAAEVLRGVFVRFMNQRNGIGASGRRF